MRAIFLECCKHYNFSPFSERFAAAHGVGKFVPNHVNIVCRLIYLFILLSKIWKIGNCVIFPITVIRALVIRIRIFLVCSVVAALTDLPHQKRIFLEPYFFCQFSGEVTIHMSSEICRRFRFVDIGVLIHGGSLE